MNSIKKAEVKVYKVDGHIAVVAEVKVEGGSELHIIGLTPKEAETVGRGLLRLSEEEARP